MEREALLAVVGACETIGYQTDRNPLFILTHRWAHAMEGVWKKRKREKDEEVGDRDLNGNVNVLQNVRQGLLPDGTISLPTISLPILVLVVVGVLHEVAILIHVNPLWVIFFVQLYCTPAEAHRQVVAHAL